MRLKIEPEDRKLMLVFGTALAFALALAAYLAVSDAGEGGIPSSYSAGNAGTKAAYLLLQQSGYTVHRWTRDPQYLSELPATATLVLAEPVVSEERDVEAVRTFVRRGGHVLTTG